MALSLRTSQRRLTASESEAQWREGSYVIHGTTLMTPRGTSLGLMLLSE